MKKILISLISLTVLFSTGCEDFIDVNENPNAPTDVSEKLLLAPIQYSIAHDITTGPEAHVATFVNHYMQNIAYNQALPNFGTYQLTPNDVNASWSGIFTSLQNLKMLQEKGEANSNYNYAGIAKILTAMCLGVATDLWGDIPYTEAFQGSANLTPAYDSQEFIYTEIQTLLDAGIADIDRNTGLVPGTDDYYYTGDMAKWKRLAYTLKARYYMHLTEAPGHTAAAQASLALAALQNGMASNEDGLEFSYPGGPGTESRWFLNMLPVSTLVASSAIVDTLVSRNDPRLPYLVAPSKRNGTYAGRPIGTPTTGDLQAYSLLGSAYAGSDATLSLLPYAEALFLKTEATLIAAGAAAAQPFYQEGIKAHMAELEIDNSAIDAYLATRGTLTEANALERIMEEKSIANFLSLENYNDWRRTGYPAISPVPNALSDIPRRFLYPQSEASTNPQRQHTAKLSDKVWWDQ